MDLLEGGERRYTAPTASMEPMARVALVGSSIAGILIVVALVWFLFLRNNHKGQDNEERGTELLVGEDNDHHAYGSVSPTN